MTRKASVWVLAVLLAAGGFYLGVRTAPGGTGADAPAAGPEGERAGELAIPAPAVGFRTLEGDTASLADHRGSVVVLNFWGTWCPPCRREIPHLVELQDAIEPRGGTVIGIAVDSGTPEQIREFTREFGVNYPIWISSTPVVVDHFPVMGFPTTLLIDRGGVVRKQFLGPQTAARLLEELEGLL